MICHAPEKTARRSGRIFNKKNDEEFLEINAPARLPIILEALGDWVLVHMHGTYLAPEDTLR